MQVGEHFTAVGLYVDDALRLYRQWDRSGQLEVVEHMPVAGYGMRLQWSAGELVQFEHRIDGQREGRFWRATGDQREEHRYRSGVRHGLSRTWSQDGQLEELRHYEDGLLHPVVRYTGSDKGRGATLHRDEWGGVGYEAPRALTDTLEVGMTVEEVATVLKQDVSLVQGVAFYGYSPETVLILNLDDGRIVEREEAWNGLCFSD